MQATDSAVSAGKGKQETPEPSVALRPRDAATLILLERQGGDVKVLMGRRSARHVFMPGKLVFPGGRTDPADARVRVSEGLHPQEETKLSSGSTRMGPARARAIAMSALRETYEEAGLLIGKAGSFSTRNAGWLGFAENGVEPTLDCLRYVARAVTPPGQRRRFDTRFLACWRDRVAVSLEHGGVSDELQDLAWLSIGEAIAADVPSITRLVLQDLRSRLMDDPQLQPGGPVPFYRFANSRRIREII